MKRVLPLLIFSATALFAQPTVPGSWTITGDVQGFPVNETCTFTQAKDKITGSCTNAESKTYDTTVTITGQKVVFVHGGEYQGQALTVTFTGTFNDKGNLSGDIYVDPMAADGTFTAKKADKADKTEKPEAK
jgi:hypothetical protein